MYLRMFIISKFSYFKEEKNVTTMILIMTYNRVDATYITHVFLYEIHFLQHPAFLFKPIPHVTDTGSYVTHGGRGTRA